MTQSCYHVIVLSNFARGFDKYSDSYSKAFIPESTYPDRFYVLRRDQLDIGIRKASGLLEKLGLPCNELLALETDIAPESLHANERTGLGQYVLSSSLRIARLFRVVLSDGDSGYDLVETTPEDTMARSLSVLHRDMKSFDSLIPRTLSVLPIARGCQASCPFCFSEASISSVQEQSRLDPDRVRRYAQIARARGAERFVITGGGEPGLIRHPRLLEWIECGAEELGKTVLITNGYHLASISPSERLTRLADYANAGLNVLAISRHHADEQRNTELMNLDIDSGAVARTCMEAHSALQSLRLRFICVLQSKGVASPQSIADYLTFAASLGVEEVCFKELYVSTSTESVFHAYPANTWSRAHRVPLSLVVDFAMQNGFVESSRLPWGSPVFSGVWNGSPMRIAAYTEPSLFWERSQGIARSWNVMADGKCFVSLEDRASALDESMLEQVAL